MIGRNQSAAATVVAFCVSTPFAFGSAEAALVPLGFQDQQIAGELLFPTNFDFLPDGRVLLVEQRTAALKVVQSDSGSTALLVGTIPDVETAGYEQGLLGVAVDPRWPTKPYVYVHYTSASSPNVRVSRFELTGDLTNQTGGDLSLNVGSVRHILADLPDDSPVHNGGTILFGTDGFLHVSLGDDLVTCSGQDIHEMRGKILRINATGVPDGPGATPTYQSLAVATNPFFSDQDPRARLVWQFGLRNPFSFDLDRVTGAIVIGDVGETEYEELNMATLGGRNFGWPWYEGPWRFHDWTCPDDTSTITPPSFWYQHENPFAPATIIMGGVSRTVAGSSISFPPEYEGHVFYADHFEGAIKRLACQNGSCFPLGPVLGQPTYSSWAVGLFMPTRLRFGPDGALWYLTTSEMRRIVRYDPDLVDAADPGRRDGPDIRSVFPVPARDVVTLSVSLPAAGALRLDIYDAVGRRVRALAAYETYSSGVHHVVWDGRGDDGSRASPGVYFARLRFAGQAATRRLLMVRDG